ncbi:hypothetical protein [Patiriisocius marinus]|uniref:Photosystem I assembly protein Ycf4 n=1 Tax=Patiriisocius marinus TaxID=1397112 RepID=A0A5J4J331_9FLAO|nr:hypothetical protein [Patiriisocius marinus]GER60283.1 hypothetical protein ULMA_23910 [Patiriisocius marinus]
MRAFTEIQRFTQSWLLIILILAFGFVGYGLFKEYTTLDVNSNSEVLKFLLGVFIAVFSLGLIFIFQLKTKINEQGIFYGFWPIQRNLKHIKWEEIDKIYVREYSPISEYGGWGYRFSFGKHGKAYNVSGSTGIQIIFKNGKKTLIGTQKKKEAESVINTYKNKLNENLI